MLLYKLVWALHVINVVLLIIVVLLQTGKGSEVGFAFGQGAANTMFGSGGGKSFITKLTVILAVLFMGTSIFLALYQAKGVTYKGVLNSMKTQEQPAIPAGQQEVPAEAVPGKPLP